MTIVARGSAIAFVIVLALVVSAVTAPAAQQRVGVSTAVNPDATGAPPGAPTRQLMLGQEVVYHEHIVTTTSGQTQILFLDESAMTIAPNSDLTIDEFVYNPDTGKGELAMSAVRGIMRFVGGKLSKNENAVTMVTPTGTLSIRGGVFLMDLEAGGNLQVVFLYGKGLTITGTNGVSQTITRPGFAVTIAGRGAAPSTPAPPPPGALGRFLTAFSGQTGSSAGAANPPTDAAVANSGLGSIISGNFAASVQAANQNQPPSGQPPQVNVGTLQTNAQVNTVQSQPQTGITNGVVVYPFGFWANAYSDGSVALTVGTNNPFAALANGVLKINSQPNQNGVTLPLPTGMANFGPPGATDSKGNPIVGVSYLSPDQSLFYGYGNNLGKGLGTPNGNTTFVLGGVPTVNLPTMGIGTYSGSAFGGVYNNGASYVATGSFTANYNFGNLSGTMTINNLDGNTFGGPITGLAVTGSHPQYQGVLTGNGLVGVADGFFFGTAASTTGGLFEAVSTLNPTAYHIVGVYGGVRH
jgi:hypothetical protein